MALPRSQALTARKRRESKTTWSASP